MITTTRKGGEARNMGGIVLGRFTAAMVATAIVVIAGCSRVEPAQVGAAGPAAAAPPAALPTLQDGLVRTRSLPGQGLAEVQAHTGEPAVRRDAPIASLPNRGELARFEASAPVAEGAYTWHAVELSEAHALASLESGVMTLRAPNGQVLALEYDRHEEHASGDWTWIGRVRGLPREMGEVLITFGHDAVFGEIRQADPNLPPLQLATRSDGLWLGETTYEALRENPPARPENDGIMPPSQLPPHVAVEAAAAAEPGEAPPVHAWTADFPIVDVMIGYTAGYRNSLGSPSAAVTRLNFLVDVTNAALKTSKVNARVRLVHTVLVDYPDTEIYQALDELTGVGDQDPVALRPLRGELRDLYGADLVSLMMDTVAQQGACGLAYVLGNRGANPPIPASHQAYGFSAHYRNCDKALPHELGHNFGLNHDQITSAGSTAGPYEYSFGFKITQPDGIGFHDLMAYGNPGAPGYNYYSNPGVRFKNYPGGTWHTSNAALSLKNTLSYIAQFRPTKVFDGVRARNDISGDGKSDLMFHNINGGSFRFWRMDGSTVAAESSSSSVPENGRLVASGDFEGDGRTDLVWMDASRRLWVWRSTGTGWNKARLETAHLTTATEVVGAADLDGDGRDELLLTSTVNHRFSYWKLEGNVPQRGRTYTLPVGARLVAAGDFNNDGMQDLVWQAPSRQLYLWWSNGGTLDSLNFAHAMIDRPVPAGQEVVAAADITGDGKSDLLFFNSGTREAVYWVMNRNLVTTKSTPRFIAANARFAATGDFNGDGNVDVVWRTGNSLQMWFGRGNDFPWQVRTLNHPLTGSWHARNGGVGGG